ncbi:rod shape-determining protein MreD [Niabella beijingensis]|uniref:rod shape-determining protein MreD n=1 Tax=Niabella beijingensis TaxID=2872700 RepID=UPI001CBF21AC|nr:rod shape-determining protein MreD [Niabella beijingensis]MBZ4190040.1 rod shape-determining protein MreD [Niabella beijingensis]
MSDLVKNIIRFLLFVFVQVYVLDVMPHLHELITPYLYFLFLLWLPFSIKKGWLLLLGFLLGMTVDYFTMTPGLHAAACVLVAFLRPLIIHLLSPKDATGYTYQEPSPKAMGWSAYGLYALLLSFAHNFYLLFLEWLSFGSFMNFLVKVLCATAISMLLIFITELLFFRKQRYRTNTA